MNEPYAVNDHNSNLFSEIYPTSISTEIGQTETLSCLVISINGTKLEDDEVYDVAWYKNSLENQIPHNKLILTIKIISNEDLGNYYCRLKDLRTNKYSNFARAFIKLKDNGPSDFKLLNLQKQRRNKNKSQPFDSPIQNSAFHQKEKHLIDEEKSIEVIDEYEDERSQNLNASEIKISVEGLLFNITFMLENKLRLQNKKILIQNNGDIPEELGIFYFPAPLINEHDMFNYNYRLLITKFQKEILDFTNNYLAIQIGIIDEYIRNIKDEHSNNIENLNLKISKIEEKLKKEILDKKCSLTKNCV